MIAIVPHKPTVLVAMPYWKCPDTVERAIRSVLDQTYKNLILLVLIDGDAESYPRSAYIEDERLIHYDLGKNRGRYFADAVALTTNPYQYFMTHDADDWSEPTLIERLMEVMGSGTIGAAYCTQWVHPLSRPGKLLEDYSERMKQPLGPKIKHIAQHHGALYKTETLKAAGGYHPGFRVGYDTLLANLIKMTGGNPFTLREPLYHRVGRTGSLTKDPDTGLNSVHRNVAFAKIKRLYETCLHNQDKVKEIIERDIGRKLLRDVEVKAEQLRDVLEPQ